jgi:hypothetical protein
VIRRRALAVFALLATPILLSGCTAPKTIDAVWPTATSERAVLNSTGVTRWPLTGLVAPSAEAVLTRVVSVKIDNSAAARPQSGLDKADIVYETLTEGGVTRFNALFQSHTPKVVGPVRSARPSDFAIVRQYRAIFAHCGGDAAVRKALQNTKLYNDMDQFLNAGPYTRSKDRSAPNNLYLSITKLRTAAISSRGYAATATVEGPTFVHAATNATPTVTSLTVAFSSVNKVVWRYNTTRHVYMRSVNGTKQKDKVSGAQYSARNVVVLWTSVKRYTASSNASLRQYDLTGSGRASIFRDGQRFEGTWQAGTSTAPVLRSSDGRLIGLDAGTTWFQVIGNDQDIVMN